MARIQILVEVDTDQVPGWGYDPQDYVKHIAHHLEQTIPHYNPIVTLSDGIFVAYDSVPDFNAGMPPVKSIHQTLIGAVKALGYESTEDFYQSKTLINIWNSRSGYGHIHRLEMEK